MDVWFKDWWLYGDKMVSCVQVMCNQWHPCSFPWSVSQHSWFWVCCWEKHTLIHFCKHAVPAADRRRAAVASQQEQLIIPARPRGAWGQEWGNWALSDGSEGKWLSLLTSLLFLFLFLFLFLLLLGVMLLSAWLLTSSGTSELSHLITKHLRDPIITYMPVNRPLCIDIYLTASPALVLSGDNESN